MQDWYFVFGNWWWGESSTSGYWVLGFGFWVLGTGFWGTSWFSTSGWLQYAGLDNQLHMHIGCTRIGGMLQRNKLKINTECGLRSFPYICCYKNVNNILMNIWVLSLFLTALYLEQLHVTTKTGKEEKNGNAADQSVPGNKHHHCSLPLFILIWITTTIITTTKTTTTTNTKSTTTSSSTASNGLTAMRLRGREPVEGVVIHKMGQLSQKRRCPPPKSPSYDEKGKLSAWKKRG